MGACIVSCSNDDGQNTSSTDPDEVGGESFTIPRIEFAFAGARLFWSTRNSLRCIIFDLNNDLKIRVYKSKDLSTWKDEGVFFYRLN